MIAAAKAKLANELQAAYSQRCLIINHKFDQQEFIEFAIQWLEDREANAVVDLNMSLERNLLNDISERRAKKPTGF